MSGIKRRSGRAFSQTKQAVLRPGSGSETTSCASQSSAISGKCVITSIWRKRLLSARSSERSRCQRAYHILRELGEEALAPIEQAAAEEEAIAAAA
jgi:hypothetical protein